MTGKIARLPREIRYELSRRLDRGETGKALVQWLNQLPEVKAVLMAQFGGRPINEVNLSEWKAREYREWRARQEILGEALEISGTATELSKATEGKLSDNVATLLSARYLKLLAHWDGEVTEEFKRQVRGLAALSRDVVQLRRGDHRLIRQDQFAPKSAGLEQALMECLQKLTANPPAPVTEN